MNFMYLLVPRECRVSNGIMQVEKDEGLKVLIFKIINYINTKLYRHIFEKCCSIILKIIRCIGTYCRRLIIISDSSSTLTAGPQPTLLTVLPNQ